MKVLVIWVIAVFFAISVYADFEPFPRNPFLPLSNDIAVSLKSERGFSAVQPVIKLKGIIWDPVNPTAVLSLHNSDQVMQVGDSIFDVEIVEIGRRRVELVESDQSSSEDSLLQEPKTFILTLGMELKR